MYLYTCNLLNKLQNILIMHILVNVAAQVSYRYTIVCLTSNLSNNFRSEKSNDEIVLEIVDDIQRHVPLTIEDYSDVRESQTSSTQQLPRPKLKDILFKEAPEMKDKEKEKGQRLRNFSVWKNWNQWISLGQSLTQLKDNLFSRNDHCFWSRLMALIVIHRW